MLLRHNKDYNNHVGRNECIAKDNQIGPEEVEFFKLMKEEQLIREKRPATPIDISSIDFYQPIVPAFESDMTEREILILKAQRAVLRKIKIKL